MRLKYLKLVTDWPGRIYLPRNKQLIKEIKNIKKKYQNDCDEIEVLFEMFEEAGWILSSKKFNDEKGGYFAFKPEHYRIYGLVYKVTGGCIFVITEIFRKQNKPKEHNAAVKVSKERMRHYEEDIKRIEQYQKENPPHNPKNN